MTMIPSRALPKTVSPNTRLFPDLEYTFKDALTHEVSYGSLLGDRRRQFHAEIAIPHLMSSV
jgi:hypothetical protein